jgi:cell division protein ZapA
LLKRSRRPKKPNWTSFRACARLKFLKRTGTMKNQLKFEILGTKFVIQSGDEPEYLERIARYLTSKINEVKNGTTITEPFKLAVLAGLNLVDELFKSRNGAEPAGPSDLNSLELEEITRRMISKIDKNL